MKRIILKFLITILKVTLNIITLGRVSRDPILRIKERPLVIDDELTQRLIDYSKQPKFEDLLGLDLETEKDRLNSILTPLINDLLAHSKANPSKLWVMKQFQKALIQVESEDTEARECFGMELEEIMDIYQIKSSDNLLTYYLG